MSFVIDKAILIGTGGTGGLLADPLVRTLNYHPRTKDAEVLLVDGDTYEEGNVSRQQCGPAHVGQAKAAVLAERLQGVGLRVSAISDYMNNERMRELLTGTELPLIIAAVDNQATRAMVLKRLDKRADFIFLTPGNNDNADGKGRISVDVIWWARIGNATYGMDPRITSETLKRPSDSIPEKGSCSENQASAPQLIAANALAAAWTLTFLQNLLDDRLPEGPSQFHADGRGAYVTVA